MTNISYSRPHIEEHVGNCTRVHVDTFRLNETVCKELNVLVSTSEFIVLDKSLSESLVNVTDYS